MSGRREVPADLKGAHTLTAYTAARGEAPGALFVNARYGPAEAWQKLFEPGSAACEEKLSHSGFGLSKRLRAIAITPSALLPRRVRCSPITV